METVQNIVLIIFITLGLMLIIKGYYPIVIHFLHIKNESTLRKRKIEQELYVLQSSQDSAKKADAFISLMNLSYIHLLMSLTLHLLELGVTPHPLFHRQKHLEILFSLSANCRSYRRLFLFLYCL